MVTRGAGVRPCLPPGVTHLLDTSAALAGTLGERGWERVRSLIADPQAVVGVSVLTLDEAYTIVLHRTGSDKLRTEALESLRRSVTEVLPVDEAASPPPSTCAARPPPLKETTDWKGAISRPP